VLTITATGPRAAELTWTPSVGATGYWVWITDSVAIPEWARLPFPLSQENSPWPQGWLTPHAVTE
jgi:hypothetical protein